MYTGYLLTEETRSKLLKAYPPKYANVVCHHITEHFPAKRSDPAPAMPNTIKVIGHIDSGDGVEGLLVAINGSSMRPDGSRYHITHSLADGRKPVETNKYVDDAIVGNPMDIIVEPKNFSK